MDAKEYLKLTNPNIGVRLQELNISGNIETIMESYLAHETPRIKAETREEVLKEVLIEFEKSIQYWTETDPSRRYVGGLEKARILVSYIKNHIPHTAGEDAGKMNKNEILP